MLRQTMAALAAARRTAVRQAATAVLALAALAATVAVAATSAADRQVPRLPDANVAPPGMVADASTADAQARAHRASAAGRDERDASRTAFRDLDAPAALGAVKRRFPTLLAPGLVHWPPAHGGQEVTGFLGDYAAMVRTESGRRAVVESSLPLRGTTASGDEAPIDLTLRETNGHLRPRSAAAAIEIPTHSNGELRFPDHGFGVRLDGAEDRDAAIESNKAFFANALPDADLLLDPRPLGAELSVVMRSPETPTTLTLSFDLSGDQVLRTAEGSAEIVEGSRRVATIGPASAVDAQGATVPVRYHVHGGRLAMDVDTSGEVAYPVLVDPPIGVYDNNGTSVGSTSTGWRWPTWTRSTYGSDSFSPCSSGVLTWFWFCQGTLSGDYTTGGALYVRANPFVNFTTNDWAQWLKQAPPDAYIYGFDTAAVSQGHQNSKLFAGAWSWNEPPWGWQRGSVLLPNGGGAVNSSYAYYEDPDDNVPGTLYYKVHGGQPTDSADPYPTGNYVAFGMRMTGGAPTSVIPYVALGGGATYESEVFAPTLDAPTHTTAPSSSWVTSYSDTLTAKAHDRGLGMGTITASGPQLNASASRCVANGGPSGNTSGAGAKNFYDSCIPDSDPNTPELTLSSTYNAPEGIDNYTVSASDLVTNSDSAQNKTWQVKVDASAPGAQLSGPLWTDRNFISADGTEDTGYVSSDETLQVDASDGSSATPRSGVASIEMNVDGRRVRPEDLYTQSCTSSGCPYAGSHQFTFHPSDFSEGDHRVTVIVRDQLANPTGTSAGTHTTVRELWVHVGPPETEPQESGETYLPPPPDTNPNAAPSAPDDPTSPFVDPLTTTQVTQAQLDVQRDATSPLADLNHVLGLTGYTIESTGVLTQGEDPATGKEINIGASIVLNLNAAINVSTTVPSWRPSTPEYVAFRAQFTGTAVTDLFVDVDLRTNTIINISPGPDSNATTFAPVPGTPQLPPEPRED